MFIPRPEKELLHKEISHNTLDLTEACRKGSGLVCEGFDEAGLILLAVKPQDKGLLTRLNDLMGTVNQDSYRRQFGYF